jgi:hypothetical protein
LASHIRSEAALHRLPSRFDDVGVYAAADDMPPRLDPVTIAILDQFR